MTMSQSQTVNKGVLKRGLSSQISTNQFKLSFFFFNDTATTEIYTLSLHDALPIYQSGVRVACSAQRAGGGDLQAIEELERSEEHTSELQSQSNLVCRLLLEKKINAAWAEPASARTTIDSATRSGRIGIYINRDSSF